MAELAAVEMAEAVAEDTDGRTGFKYSVSIKVRYKLTVRK